MLAFVTELMYHTLELQRTLGDNLLSSLISTSWGPISLNDMSKDTELGIVLAIQGINSIDFGIQCSFQTNNKPKST